MSHSYESFYMDQAWHGLMRDVLQHGVERPDRTGHGTRALFGTQMRLTTMRHGFFPATTTKKLFVGQVWAELAAFLKGRDTLEEFHTEGCAIWDANGTADYWVNSEGPRWEGDLGRIYGVQWRDWLSVVTCTGEVWSKSTDQLQALLEGLERDPFGRRHVVSAWNPGELDQMCLPPCHVLFQCFVEPYAAGFNMLSMRVDMRSVDLFLGLPFDVASYATLLQLICDAVGMAPGDLVFQMGDSHIYNNHLEAVTTVLGRDLMPPPTLELEAGTDIFTFSRRNASLKGYVSHEAVAAPMNV